ncbi:MAG: TIGR03668 family PPOX class F420-dependent oxidoreductase [SAR324 cluster bacterium]
MAARLDPDVVAFLAAARVARMATVDSAGAPLVLPICFAVSGTRLFLSLDEKPKRRDPLDLERVRNLRANPRVAVVADRWDEDWSRLAWVHLSGTARLAMPGEERETHGAAVALLREKYPPYRRMAIETRPLIAIDIERVKTWGTLVPPQA